MSSAKTEQEKCGELGQNRARKGWRKLAYVVRKASMQLELYTLNSEYARYLQQFDQHVFYSTGSKQKRPYVGVLFEINGLTYFAPLSSPKPKHHNMKNQVDFIKIAGGKYGVINLSAMIPVKIEYLHKIDHKFSPSDSQVDGKYKLLLANQQRWCNDHRDLLQKSAAKLYYLITTRKAWASLQKRCCDFGALEKRCLEYKQTI